MILRVTGFDFASGPIPVNIEHCTHCTSILYVHAATPPTGHGNHSLLARALLERAKTARARSARPVDVRVGEGGCVLEQDERCPDGGLTGERAPRAHHVRPSRLGHAVAHERGGFARALVLLPGTRRRW